MFREAMEQIKTALTFLMIFTLVTGLLYPLAVTGIAQGFFPAKANGSLLQQNGQVIGSRLIGQYFTSPTYFWGRPSATIPYPYNGEASRGSNLGPTNPLFLEAIKARIQQLKASFRQNSRGIPIDLVTASGSGLDPEISPYAAYYQAARIAKARDLSLDAINSLIQKNIKNRSFGFLGEPRVNVLELNLALDSLNHK
jgi:K+-transporting ATPase ATPase C chain